MEIREWKLPSSDGVSTLHGVHWIPEGDCRGVLQIAHGMVEHIWRYDEFGRYLADAGYAVIGHDHLGHGDTAASAEDLGFFAEQNGGRYLIQDMYRVTMLARRLHPGVPVFLLGHSMGSFLLRRYLTIYGSHIDGAVLASTGDYSLQETEVGISLAESVCRRRGTRSRSRLLDLVAVGKLTLQFGNSRRPGSWLSKNVQSVAEYESDPKCRFTFTAGAYRDFFRELKKLAEQKDADRIPRDLPVLFASGMDDPLGGFSKKVLAVYNRYVELQMKDVDIYLYPGDRHEILHETDRENVFRDILCWMDRRAERGKDCDC